MVIKKYQGKTEEEAMEKAKHELGSGVVLMNAKSIKQTGIFSFLKPHLMEVTVAIEEEMDTKTVKPEKITMVKETKGATSEGEQQIQKTDSDGKEEHLLEEKLDSLQLLLKQQIHLDKETKDVKQKEVKEEISDDSKDEKPEEKISEEAQKTELVLKMIRKVLEENEVDECYISGIMEDIEKTMKPDMPMEYVLSHVYQRLVLKFGKSEQIEGAAEGPKVVFFVGTTGVGKTTTIAKIASKYVVEQKKKVALLTADTYRIAAAEQLRTYADILEIPFRVIYSTQDCENAVRDYAKCDYILVDTAGHSQHNEEQRETMSNFIRCLEGQYETEVFLVLSATTKYRDLLNIADAYKEVAEYKLIFTKLDETTTYGNLLNLKLYTKAPMSYVTCGQNVPDDIDSFKAQVIVKRLLGGSVKLKQN